MEETKKSEINNDNKENINNHIKNLFKSMFKVINKSQNEELPRELEAKEILSKIAKISTEIKNEITDLKIDNKNEIISTVNSILDSLDFMNQYNKLNTFVQLPININGHQTTAELFIFKDGKNKNDIDPNNMSVFLSLNTKNLGQVESYIKVSNKNIECTFRNENQVVLDLLKANSTKLYNLLSAYDYKLIRLDYKLIDENSKGNILNVKQIKKISDTKYSIDIKV
jgi:hypothetical protein